MSTKSNTFGGLPLFSPHRVRLARERLRYDEVPALRYANSLYMPGDKWPARGWILMRRSDYNQLNLFGTYNLVIQDYGRKVVPNPALTFQNLSIVQARCVSRGIAADANALYLIELTDPRGLVWNRWSVFPTKSQYNIRSPAYPGQFYANTVVGGTPLTWNQVCQDLWNQMSGIITGYPGLPTTPPWTPEGWSFPGTSCWEALNTILAYLGLTVSVNLTQSVPYGISVLGGTDTYNSNLFSTYANLREDDWEYIDLGLGRVAGSVTVLFHRRNSYYGTEETVRRDGLQWQTTPLYSIVQNAPSPYNQGVGTHTQWADYTVEFDIDNNPVASSVAVAATIAASVATNYYNRATRSGQGFMRRRYLGALPFATGGLIDGVCWKMDEAEDRLGWTTTVVRGMDPAFPEVDWSNDG